MSDFVEDLRVVLHEEEARYGYVEAHLNAFIASQIKELRGDMSQQELAEKLGTKQSGVSRLENANYSSWKVETLRKLARAFGVRLRISFEEFGTLVPEIESLRKRLRPRKFEIDPVFGGQKEIATKIVSLGAGAALAATPKKPPSVANRAGTAAKPESEVGIPICDSASQAGETAA